MPRKFLRKYLPDRHEVLAKRWVAPLAPWLGHPNLWCLNRRSVAGAVAIGLFCGLIPGPFQMLGACLMAVPLRRNVPVAMFVTLYTNPLTIVPLYAIAYAYGLLFVGGDEPLPLPAPGWHVDELWQWMLSLGRPLGIGLVALAVTLAAVGYILSDFAWRAYVVAAWRRRARRRAGA